MERRTVALWMGGAGTGAALQYLLDPDRGARRRALVRDRIVHLAHVTREGAGETWRDARNRSRGARAMVRSITCRGGDDGVVEERVRAELGMLVSHPGSIEVEAREGRVTVSGPILASEVDDLLAGVKKVRGVREVENRLQIHERAEGIPGLQGGRAWGRSQAGRPELLQEHWAPAVRLAVASAGSGLVVYGFKRRRSPLGWIPGVAGVVIASRAVTNLPLRRLFGLGTGRRAVDIQKTIHVEAPVEEVFRFWSEYENFPRFMSRVQEVRKLQDERSFWRVAGPGGSTVEWEAVTTSYTPNEVIAWRTEPGASVQHAGIVRFEPTEDGGTRVHLRMSYNPPAGAVGHAVASVLGADAKSSLDADLLRMKTLLETGKPARDATQRAG